MESLIALISTRPLGLALAVLLAGTAAGAAAEPSTVLRWLAGRWTGPGGMDMRLDPERLQANIDPAKPFQWEALRLRDVSGCMVTFDIGPRRYVALLFGDRAMHINSFNLPGEQSLRSERDATLPPLKCPAEPKVEAGPPIVPN